MSIEVKVFKANDYTFHKRAAIISSIIDMERRTLPCGWILRDDPTYWEEIMMSPENSLVMAVNGEAVVGVFLGVPHNSCVEELQPHDPDFGKKDFPCLYIEITEIDSENRGANLYQRMVEALCSDAHSKGIYAFTSHTIISTGAHVLVLRTMKKLGFLLQKRLIKGWRWMNGEDCYYFEGHKMTYEG